MPSRCCVPMCRGNYDTGPKVSAFSFPSVEPLRSKWIAAIHREGFQPKTWSRVCARHFIEEDIIREAEFFDENGKRLSVTLKIPRLKEDAVPTKLPGCPQYLSKQKNHREDPESKRRRIENAQLAATIAENLKRQQEYERQFCFASLDGLVQCLRNVTLPQAWHIIEKPTAVCFINVNEDKNPRIVKSIKVKQNLEVYLYNDNIPLSTAGERQFPQTVSDVNALLEMISTLSDLNSNDNSSVQSVVNHIVEELNSLEQIVGENHKDIVNFVSEQLSLLISYKNRNRYSTSTLIFWSILFAISPHAYRFLRSGGFLTVPHPDTLQRVFCKYQISPKLEEMDANFLHYIKQKFNCLTRNDKAVVLLMDEIHLKPYLDYKGGSVVGVSYNNKGAATSAYVFMVQSIQSVFRDVVHIVPAKTISADCLFQILSKIICGLEKVGFLVMCVSSDNNAINRKTMAKFSPDSHVNIVYPHPSDPKRPLFFVIDPVHVIKSSRNSWFNQKNQGTCMIYPPFQGFTGSTEHNMASLETVRKLYDLENTNIVKYAYTLTQKALFPTYLERQNVKLTLQIFNRSTVEGLRIGGEKYGLPHSLSTADFIKIMTVWFEIMNVRQLFKGRDKRCVYQEPITFCESDEKIIFLSDFILWLEEWENRKPKTGFFTKETLLALKHTSYAVIEIARYCGSELGMKYLLTGKLQTDALEDRFGRYRQLAGSQYHISLVQLYECEKKLRLQSLLPLALNSPSREINIDELESTIDDCNLPESTETSLFVGRLDIKEDDFLALKDNLHSLAHVAGYCAHALLKRLSCPLCASILITDRALEETNDVFKLIAVQDRGGLKYPSSDTSVVICYSYGVISKLVSSDFEKDFLLLSNQRLTACNLIQNILLEKEDLFCDVVCPSGHKPSFLVKRLVWTSCNIFLKNYCKNVNNDCKKRNQKRKIGTFSV